MNKADKARYEAAGFIAAPCAQCGKDAYFNVGWLYPMRHDANPDTTDMRLACGLDCAHKLATLKPWNAQECAK